MDGPARPDVPPEDPRHPRVFSPAQVSSERPPILRWAAVGLIVLLVVVAKPWDVLAPGGLGDTGASPDGAGAGASARTPPEDAGSLPTAGRGTTPRAPAPSARADTAGSTIAAFCLDPAIWLVATVEVYGGSSLRIWRALDTVASATGPDDPHIPTTTIQSEGVRELGWCAPVVGPDRPKADVLLAMWRANEVDGTDGEASAAATAIDLVPVRPTGGASPFGAMYAPPGAVQAKVPAPPGSADEIWPDGRIVFRYASGSTVRWFAIEVSRRLPLGRP